MKKSKVRERELEAYLRREAEKRGGSAKKWVSPGNDGVPDRIVFLPNGVVFFVEMKTPNGVVSNLQKRQIEWLTEMGQHVVVLRTRLEIDKALDRYMR